MKLVLTWLNPPLVARGRGQARGWYEVLFIIAWGWVTWPGQGGDTAGGHGAVGTCWGGGGLLYWSNMNKEFSVWFFHLWMWVLHCHPPQLPLCSIFNIAFLLSGRNVTCIDFLNVRVLFRSSKGYRYRVVVVWCRFDVGCMKNQCRTFAR